MSSVSFILIEPPKHAGSQRSLIDEWRDAFAQHLQPTDLERFSFLERRLNELSAERVTFDCVVSPANSYGIMDGGFDLYLSKAFSPPNDIYALTRRVQAAVRDRYYGFAPPGSCTLVPGLPQNEFRCKTVAVCPTMRYPEVLTWHKDIVYNTMWSLLVELEHWNDSNVDDDKRIKTVLITGLGTGAGAIPAARCAKQMALAVKHFLYMRREQGQRDRAQNDHFPWENALDLAREV